MIVHRVTATGPQPNGFALSTSERLTSIISSSHRIFKTHNHRYLYYPTAQQVQGTDLPYIIEVEQSVVTSHPHRDGVTDRLPADFTEYRFPND